MNKHKQSGFTIVELIVVIVVIAILATIATIAYRETQKNARNEKRKVDIVMLRSAVEEYYADNGDYPKVSCATGSGGVNECQNNEVWQMLKTAGYLKTIPKNGIKSYEPIHNTNSDGTSNYIWLYSSSSQYGIYAPMETLAESCKTGKNVVSSWWSNAAECNF